MWLLGLPRSLVSGFQEQVSQHELGRSPTAFMTSPWESPSIPSTVATNLPRFRGGNNSPLCGQDIKVTLQEQVGWEMLLWLSS